MNQNYSNLPTTNSNSKKDRWLQALSASAALWMTVCFFGPLLLELTYWPISDILAYIITLLTVSLMLIVLTSFILVRLTPSGLFELATILVLTFGFMVYARFYVLQNVTDMLEKVVLNVDLSRHYVVIGALLFSVSLVAIWLLRRSLIRHITVITIVFIAYQIVFATAWYTFGPIPKQKYGYRLINNYSNSFSKSRNILVLTFDCYDADDFKLILNNNKKLADCLAGFTFYPDSLGGYDNTRSAVPHILTGLFHDNSVPMNEFLNTKLPLESIPGILKRVSFRTEAYGAGACVALQASVLDNITTKKRILLEPSEVARVIIQFVIRFTPHFARKYLMGAYVMVSRGTPYGFDFLGSAYDLVKIEQLERLARADTVAPVFKYEHFWGAHPPYILSETMQIRQKSSTLEGRIDQSKAAMKLCCKYLGVLKKIGAYDNSMIFVIGDHGYIERPDFPLMMWKPFNDSQSFRISSRPVAQADIIRTICDELSIPLSRPHAEPLRQESSTSTRIRRHMPNSLMNLDNATEYIPDLREFMVTGTRDNLFTSIPSFRLFQPGHVEVIPKLDIGSKLSFKKGGNYQFYTGVIGWNAPQVNIVWTRGPVAGLFLPINNYRRAVNISIRCQPLVSAPHISEQSLKVIGGNELLLFEGKLAESGTIKFLAPPDAFTGDVLPLYFHISNIGCTIDLERAPNEHGMAVGFESLIISN
jgi:hypothetical protein